MSSSSKTRAIMPCQTLRGHTDWVNGVVHLHAGRQIITCSTDRSLRLWDLESGTQIGEDWRDEEDESGVWSMALSPNSKTVASGSGGKVKLWDVETRKVIAKWSGHTNTVCALDWSADGKRVLSGSWDETARVWDVESGKTVLTIETRHRWVNALIYSPDGAKIATGGDDENAVKIWDANTGELFDTLKHDDPVWSLAWTSDGKKLISTSYDLIRIYDTTTWEQIAHLGGDGLRVDAITLSQNNRLLCASDYQTVRLWNLDTNPPVGPLLQHEDQVNCAALSADGKLLVTGRKNGNAYVWDIQAILKEAGLEHLLPPASDVTAQESLMNADATQAVDDEFLPDFFKDAVDGANSSGTYTNYHPSSSHRPRPLASSFESVNTLFHRLSSPFRRSHSKTNGSTELQQYPRRASLSPGPRIVDVAAVKDREVIFTAPLPPEKAQQQTQSHVQESSTTQPASGTNPTTPRPRYPLSVRLLAHLVLFLCCASPQNADGNAQPIQQEGQPQCQVHTQASSSQSHPATPSTSTTPPAPATSTVASGAATVQSRPLPLRARFVLFLCCTSPPHADGH